MFSKSSLSALFGAVCLGGAAQAAPVGTIKFCLDRADPMFNVAEAVANAAAAQQGMAAVLVLRDSSKDDQDSDSAFGQNKFFAKLSKTCDLIMGFPVEAAYLNLPDGMAATLPYAATGFVTATTDTKIASFPAMARTAKLGVVTLTVTSTYFTEADMSHEIVYYSNDELYGALLDGEVNAALIWQPWLDRELAAHPQKLHVAALEMPHAAWNMVALYPQSESQGPAVRGFNAGLAALSADGKLEALVQPYGVPKLNQ